MNTTTFDEETMNKVLDAFVDRRMSTDAFLSATKSLCACCLTDDPMDKPTHASTHRHTHARSALLEICSISRDYAYSLGPGCGYRISDDEFHREVRERWTTASSSK